MTITSFTDASKSYETTLDDCKCGDFIYRKAARGECCKHMEALRLAYARARRAAFNELCYKYDVRSEAQQAARREAYCVDFAIYG